MKSAKKDTSNSGLESTESLKRELEVLTFEWETRMKLLWRTLPSWRRTKSKKTQKFNHQLGTKQYETLQRMEVVCNQLGINYEIYLKTNLDRVSKDWHLINPDFSMDSTNEDEYKKRDTKHRGKWLYDLMVCLGIKKSEL